MREELEDYRPHFQTGSHVLDTILAGKENRIRTSGIEFTCICDGQLLERLHVTDICTIFGNALDNAIEYAACLAEPEKRTVRLHVAERQGFLYILIANYFEGEMELRDGFPVTRKTDRRVHGYGVKSIAYAVRKYGGSVTFSVRENEFAAEILIP